MADFSQQIASFINYGTYNYQFDSVGNEILNQSSSIFQQVYFTLPLGNFTYNNSKVLSFYNPTFTEFIPISSTGLVSSFSQAAIDQINQITYQNTQLQNQLSAVVASSSMNSSSADMQSIENTIINLRIQLGQGSVPSDFQSVYPYLPVQLEQQNPPSS
jgi:uncharacterized protein YkwD